MNIVLFHEPLAAPLNPLVHVPSEVKSEIDRALHSIKSLQQRQLEAVEILDRIHKRLVALEFRVTEAERKAMQVEINPGSVTVGRVILIEKPNWFRRLVLKWLGIEWKTK